MRCAADVSSSIDRLDILLNNAGVVNFALTGRLFPLLAATPGARVW